jgi:hypothetical protein
MNEKERDLWLDKLVQKQKELEQELRDMDARFQSIPPQAEADDPEETRREVENNTFLAKRLRELEEKADAAGRARAERLRRELNEARGYAPDRRGGLRPGAVRL